MRLTDLDLERLGSDPSRSEQVQAAAREALHRRLRSNEVMTLTHVLTRGAEQGRAVEALMDYLNEGRLP